MFSIFDGHPFTWLFDQEAETYQYNGYDYFSTCESGAGWPNSYIGDIGIPLEQQARNVECLWPVSRVFQVLTQCGLVAEHFGEHPEPYWDNFPHLKPELNGKIPNTFSILARKPQAQPGR